MAQTMKIKRSTGSGKPTTVSQGELFYAYGSASGTTYGKRLSIGHVDGGGNTPEIIGGSFFMDMLDHDAGTLTASSAILVDDGGYIDELKIKAQGDLKLFEATANGTNYVGLQAPASVSSDLTYTLPAPATISNENGKFLQTNGSGVLSWAAVGQSLTVDGDTGTQDASLTADDLQFLGTANEIETAVTKDGTDVKVTIGLPTNVIISGNLTVSGDTTTVNTSTLDIEDPLLSLAKNNTSSDAIDIGFFGTYEDSGDEYAGFFRDASDSGKWKLFKGLEEGYKPDATVNTSHGSYAVATLVAHLEDSAVAITGGSITGITDITVADGGTGLSAVAKGSILAANTANVLSAVDGGGSTDKFLLYTAASDTVSWTNTVDGGTYS
jgi:hypothetical protein